MSWINSILGLIGFVFVLPIAAAHLSEPQFTLWLLGNTILAIGIMFETSVSVVFTRMLTATLERSNIATQPGMVADQGSAAAFTVSSALLYLAMGLAGSLASYLLGLVSVSGIISFGLDPAEAQQTLLSFAVVAMSSVLLSFGRSVLIARQQMRAQRAVMLLTTVVKLGLSIVILAVFSSVALSMVAIALVNLIESIVVVGLSWPLFRRAMRTRPSLAAMDGFFSPFVKSFVIRIGSYLTLYSSSLIIVRYTPTDADGYLLAFRLVQAAASVSIIPVSVSLPALTRLRARIDAGQIGIEAFIEASVRVITFSLSWMLLFVLAFLVFGAPVIGFAMPSVTLLDTPALAYLCLIFLLESHHLAHAMVYETQNRVPYLVISILSGIAILGLSLLLVPRYGIWGALVAMNLVQMSANNWVPVLLNLRQWKISLPSYVRLVGHFGRRPSLSKLLDPDT